LFLLLKESSLSVDTATTLKPRDSSTTITKMRHQHVTYGSNTSIIGKNIIYRFTSSYQERRAGNPLTDLTPSHWCACFEPGSGFLTSDVVVCICV